MALKFLGEIGAGLSHQPSGLWALPDPAVISPPRAAVTVTSLRERGLFGSWFKKYAVWHDGEDMTPGAQVDRSHGHLGHGSQVWDRD